MEFKDREGMSFDKSTASERKEIVTLLAKNSMWWQKRISLPHLLEASETCGFYYVPKEGFIHSYVSPHDIIHIPFEEFKTRLTNPKTQPNESN